MLDEARAKNALERTGKFFLADVQVGAGHLYALWLYTGYGSTHYGSITALYSLWLYTLLSQTPAEALRHVEMRSRDVAEVRPELGHSTNAGIIVGRRELTKVRP